MYEFDFARPENATRKDEVVAWLRREHAGLSVLVHPNTLDGGQIDHTKHAIWIGQPLRVRLGVFGGRRREQHA